MKSKAKEIIIKHNKGSVYLLMHELEIGFLEAKQLIDELEKDGILGPFNGVKDREILT